MGILRSLELQNIPWLRRSPIWEITLQSILSFAHARIRGVKGNMNDISNHLADNLAISWELSRSPVE
jgi:hypothetical protein